ncbi:MAG: hypothetical protein JRI53_08070, partial [Deltaproteobacteria bacterium]|nr:hypothetical protein [Deltaproteobacteria bacterium]
EGELRDADGYIVELRRTRKKLTPAQLFEIPKRYAVGDVTQAELAAEYGVDASAICRIIQAFTEKDD